MQNRIYIILLILIGVIGIKALLHPGFYTSHDGRHQIIRLMHFHQGLVDGQVPPRWAGTAFNGYGYPLFIFTYRFPFWVAESWYLISKNLGDAIKFAFIISFLASGLTMYWFASKLWFSRLAGFIGAVLYLWAPYCFLNIFVRASLGEVVTSIFTPLIFLSFFSLAEKKAKHFFWTLILTFSLAGLILSHATIFVIYSIPVSLWLILNLFRSREKTKYLFSSVSAAIASLCLTSYYWIPAAVERKEVKFAAALTDYYKNHFVSLRQLLYSKWGFGFDLPGVVNDMMSFQVGIAQWVIVFLSLIILFIFITNKTFIWKKLRLKPANMFLLNKSNLIINFCFFMGLFIMSIYLMLSYSSWFYKLIEKFFIIDIPWRFLTLSVFSASLLAGGVVVLFKNNLIKWGTIISILFLAFYGNRNHLRVNQYLYIPDSEYWQSTETSNEHEDYIPYRLFFSLYKFKETDPQLTTVEGLSNNKLLDRKSNFFKFYSEVNSEKATIITKVAYYPGWQIFVDGKKQNISGQNGRISISLDRGNHLIVLMFQETSLRYFTNWLSLGTLLFLVGAFLVFGIW